ncbi:MAG: DUF4912 domain-containing protein [Candidatus Omnitrophota bacterium]
MAKVSKVKNRPSRNKKTRVIRKSLRRSRVKKVSVKKVPVPVKVKKEVIVGQKTAVEKTKFSATPEAPGQYRAMSPELPSEYGQDRFVLQVRDPWWIYAYWEIKSQTFRGLINKLGDDFYKARRILRVYDVSHIIFNGQNAHRFFDIQIPDYANSWYIDTSGPGRSWCVDLGLLLPDGRFIMVLRSNTVTTPIDGPSWITDEEWMIPEDMFARLYGMGFGLGKSSPVGKGWQEKVKIKREFLSSSAISSKK